MRKENFYPDSYYDYCSVCLECELESMHRDTRRLRDQVVYYLDLDGDGYGVDDAEWNQYCCSGAMPSAMYTTVGGHPTQ